MMNRSVLTVILTFSACLYPALATEAPTVSSQPVAKPRAAHCASGYLKICPGPQTVLSPSRFFPDLLNSRAVLGRAAEDLGMLPEVREACRIEIDEMTFPKDGLSLRITLVTPGNMKPEAKETLAALPKYLQPILDQEYATNTKRSKDESARVQAQLNLAKEQLDELYAKQHAFRSKAGRVDLRREAIFEEIRGLQQDKRRLDMDLVGTRARREALLMQVETISHQIAAVIQNDPVAAELQKVADARKGELERLRLLYTKGVVGENEIPKAEAELAEVRARLAERREQAHRAAGGELLTRFNGELAELTISSAESQARLKFVEEQLARIESTGLLDLVDEYEKEVASNLSGVNKTVERLRERADELRSQIALGKPPTVTVLNLE